MKNSRLFPSLVLAAALAALFLCAARANENETSTIKFTDPAKPGTLKISTANGDVRIHGSDSTEVSVISDVKPDTPEVRKDGLRVLTASSSFSLTEKDNVVSLTYGSGSWPANGGDFDITVPKSTNIVISSAFGGDIDIGGINGDVEVKSLNGEVKLSDVAGGALVETMNGEIQVSVRQLRDNKPLSFTSMSGTVTVYLPVDAKANVRLRTHNGSILTDFDDKQLVTKTASLRAGDHHSSHSAKYNSDSDEIRAAVHDAVKAGVEAAKEVAAATREAARAARDAAREAANEGSDDVAPTAPIPPVPPLPPMTGGKIVTGTLNGGGPEVSVTTMNGDVTLRKAEQK